RKKARLLPFVGRVGCSRWLSRNRLHHHSRLVWSLRGLDRPRDNRIDSSRISCVVHHARSEIEAGQRGQVIFRRKGVSIQYVFKEVRSQAAYASWRLLIEDYSFGSASISFLIAADAIDN